MRHHQDIGQKDDLIFRTAFVCVCECDLHRAELKITPLNQMNKQTSYIFYTAFSHG